VVLEALPRTPNGKVDRRALPAPEPVRGRIAVTAQEPRTQTERRLVAIWTEILNMERIGITDNFFELGGHSLLATQLISRVRSEFRNELPVRAIFEAPTIAALAAKVDKAAGQLVARPDDRPPLARARAATRHGAGSLFVRSRTLRLAGCYWQRCNTLTTMARPTDFLARRRRGGCAMIKVVRAKLHIKIPARISIQSPMFPARPSKSSPLAKPQQSFHRSRSLTPP
jgi:acyl carrier protein